MSHIHLYKNELLFYCHSHCRFVLSLNRFNCGGTYSIKTVVMLLYSNMILWVDRDDHCTDTIIEPEQGWCTLVCPVRLQLPLPVCCHLILTRLHLDLKFWGCDGCQSDQQSVGDCRRSDTICLSSSGLERVRTLTGNRTHLWWRNSAVMIYILFLMTAVIQSFHTDTSCLYICIFMN